MYSRLKAATLSRICISFVPKMCFWVLKKLLNYFPTLGNTLRTYYLVYFGQWRVKEEIVFSTWFAKIQSYKIISECKQLHLQVLSWRFLVWYPEIVSVLLSKVFHLRYFQKSSKRKDVISQYILLRSLDMPGTLAWQGVYMGMLSIWCPESRINVLPLGTAVFACLESLTLSYLLGKNPPTSWLLLKMRLMFLEVFKVAKNEIHVFWGF